MKEIIIENYEGEKLTFLTNEFDSAIIGIDSNSNRVVYSKSKMIDALVLVDVGINDYENDDTAYMRSLESIEYNTIRACQYMGDKAPIIVDDTFAE
jgi:hypothetical protein